MMKLYDMAMALVKPDQKVILKDKNSGKIKRGKRLWEKQTVKK